MAEFQPLQGGGGGASPLSPKKKIKLNKKTVMIYGGVAVGAFALMSVLMRKTTSTEAGGTAIISEELPSNSADVQAQLQNFESILTGYVDQSLGQAFSEIEASQNVYLGEVTSLLAQQKSDYTSQLNDVVSEFQKLQPSEATPTPTPVTTPKNIFTGGNLTTKETRFLRQIDDIANPNKAQLQTLGSIATKTTVNYDQSKLNEKEQRFLRQTQEIVSKGGSLSTAQQQTLGSITAKAGTVK